MTPAVAPKSQIKAMRRGRHFAVLCLVLCWLDTRSAYGQSTLLTDYLQRNLSADDGVFVADAESGAVLLNKNGDESLKPASVQKIFTSATALLELGPEYKFKTQVRAAPNAQGQASQVVIVGGGDPSLNTESLWLLARGMKKYGISSIGEIILDGSRFAQEKQRGGERAYETGTSALAFNYNSVAIEACPVPGTAGVVFADPWEAGFTVKNQLSLKGKSSGISISESSASSGKQSFVAEGRLGQDECQTVYRSVDDPTVYFGKTLSVFLQSLGVGIGKISQGQATDYPHIPLLFEQKSKPLRDIVRDLNHFSTNFIGEQIVAALGARPEGVFDSALGLERISRFAQSLGAKAGDFNFRDGSGLSHANRASAHLIVNALVAMRARNDVGPEFENSLSVSGRNGTLKKRHFGSAEVLMRGKTGTLTGVSSLAGYVRARSGRMLAICILQNGDRSKDRALQIEDRLVALLHGAY